MLEAIQQHIGKIIAFGCFLITVLTFFKIWKVRKLIELDKLYRKCRDNGQIIEETRTRNIWDYNFFPGMSKLWHFSGWQVLVAMVILLFLLLAYSFTKDDRLLNLLGVNFGIVLGMMIKTTK